MVREESYYAEIYSVRKGNHPGMDILNASTELTEKKYWIALVLRV